MQKSGPYDYLVVGSGIAGMTSALLLARGGAKVCILEKGEKIGGSLQRFRRNGIPFDTGFHFTSSLTGSLGDMLTSLGILDQIRTTPVDKSFICGEKRFDVPRTRKELCEYLVSFFPAESNAIRYFFDREQNIFENTPLFHLSQPSTVVDMLAMLTQPQKSLSDTMRELSVSQELSLLLCSFAICCCGTPADEISFDSFARINYGLNEGLIRFENGGDDLIQAFLQKKEEWDIEIRTGTTIERCIPDERNPKTCHAVQLTDGSRISFENCIFAVHPYIIAGLLAPLTHNEDFFSRISQFEESCGFFTVWAALESPSEKELAQAPNILSCIKSCPVEDFLTPRSKALGFLTLTEQKEDRTPVRTCTVFQSVSADETAMWKQSFTGRRSPDYQAYKENRTKQILEEFYGFCPELRGRLHVYETASQLTYRDHLSPFGSAYGIRQKAGQSNIFGRLPIRNFYAVGQNALLPGLFGAMQSSFLLWEKLAGKAAVQKVLVPAQERMQ